MKRASQISALVLLVLALYIGITALNLGYMEKNVPGPGFTPFWIAVFLGVFSLGILWESKSLPGTPLFSPRAFKVLAVLTVAGAATIALSYVLGLLLGLTLLAGFISRYLGGSWKQTVLTTVAVGVCFYLLFVRFLLVSFPTGILGI
ncbi:MAG TPA: hypothetical protein GX511_06810 [Firmicutes bacterium]|nr:hypothetical protein [Bacillota bacterium]